MAGKRQHYIPRFLQRGFLHPDPDGGERVWLYRKGATPRLVGIADVGVEDWFYSRRSADGEPTLDDLITATELTFLGPLQTLREMPTSAAVDSETAARLLVHLAMRTNNLRHVFAQGMNNLMDAAIKMFGDSEFARDLLGLDGEPNALVAESINSTIENLQRAGVEIPPPLAQRLMLFFIRERFDRDIGPLIRTLPATLPQVLGDISGRIRDAHNRALETVPEENAWHAELRTLQWRVEAVEGLVLPDCVGMAWESEGAVAPFILADREALAGVALPLAFDRVLVGERCGISAVRLDDINHHAARCSENLFIARDDQIGRAHVDMIGQRAAEEINHAINDAIGDLRAQSVRPGARASTVSESTKPHRASGEFSYQVTLADFGDEALAKRLGEIVQAVVSEVARALPIDELEGITFAVDYPRALREVDRGDPALPPLVSEKRAYGSAAGMPADVLRDGRPMTRLVVAAEIAAGLLGEEGETRDFAVAFLAKMLASVGHTTLFVRPLAELPKLTDPMAIALHSAVAHTPSGYFTARWGAFADPTGGTVYAELTLDSLAHAQNVIREARLAYRTNRDLESLLRVACRAVGHVLAHAAEWLGHRAGLPDGETFSGEDLPQALAAHGLDAWLELFGRDLARVYQQTDYLDFEILAGFHQHVERLLWTFQILPWPLANGDVFYSIPYGEDLAVLAERRQGPENPPG